MFFCRKCGNCCRHLEQSALYKELNRGDGVCKYLSGDLCSIYERRPLLCRVDESYDKLFYRSYSKEDYYTLNYEACEKLARKE